MTLKDFSYLGTTISGIVALIGIPIAIYQIRGLNKSLKNAAKSVKHSNELAKNANLMSILNIEFELNRRKERRANFQQQVLEKINGREETQISDEEKESIKSLEGFRKEAYEDYLNVFDRLSYFILKGRFDEEDFRLEYRDMLFDTIEKDDDEMFGQATRYRNMMKLYHSWKKK